MNQGMIINKKLQNFSVSTFISIRDITKSIGLLLGAFSINLIDILIGGMMISLAFQDVSFFLKSPWDGILIGYGIGLSLWFVQYIIWDSVLRDGVKLQDTFTILIGIIIIIGDVLIDETPLIMWLEQSSLESILSGINSLFPFLPLYTMFKSALLYSTLLLFGFGELFTVLYIRNQNGIGLLIKNKSKDVHKKQSNPPKRPDTHYSSHYSGHQVIPIANR